MATFPRSIRGQSVNLCGMAVVDVPTVTRPPATSLAAGRHALCDLLGADRVGTGEDVLAQHGHDESFHPEARPDMVVWPRSVDEAAGVVRIAVEHRLPLVPFGAGTSLEGHVCALAGGITVDMREMDAIGKPSIEDLDVFVGAGVTRRALDDRLRPEGVFFAVDPGADATIGGMVATGASGTMTVRYGAMRENVLALTWSTAAARSCETRSRARKSSAGYDLTRLMIGSEGTLGLICEATLRLHPTRRRSRPRYARSRRSRRRRVCARRSRSTRFRWRGSSSPTSSRSRPSTATTRRRSRWRRRCSSSFTAPPRRTSRPRRARPARSRPSMAAAASPGPRTRRERRKIWHARHRAYDASRALRPGTAGLTTDVCVPISALADCIEATQADIAELGVTAPIVGHVGDGNFHICVLVDPNDPDDVARAEAFHNRLVERALAHEGTCTGEHGVGYGKSRFRSPSTGRRPSR